MERSKSVNDIITIISVLRKNIDHKILPQLKTIIEYLRANGIKDDDIVEILAHCPDENLSFENLPGALWENSLLKQNVYYYHKELQIREGGTFYDLKRGEYLTKPYSVVIKIQYTCEDLVRYFYRTACTSKMIQNMERDIGACQYFLDRYKTIEIENTSAEAIDLLLYIIDFAANSDHDIKFMNLLEIINLYMAKAYSAFEMYVLNCHYYKINKMVLSEE